MSNDSPSTSSTYQSIVIALVAGLILSAGVLTVVFRRRRRARFVAMVRRAGGNVDDLRWVELADGTVVRMPEDGGLLGGGGRGRKSVGREPGLYDIQVGEGQKGEEVNVIGIVGDEWRVSLLGRRCMSCDVDVDVGFTAIFNCGDGLHCTTIAATSFISVFRHRIYTSTTARLIIHPHRHAHTITQQHYQSLFDIGVFLRHIILVPETNPS